jgi:septal ring factor EnvC (AmiA/AmiB activator)
MTDDQILQMVPDVLRAIQKEIAEIKGAQVATRMEISALGQQVAGLTTTVAGLTTAVYAGHDRFAVLEQRIERIERRLELTGGALDATP